MCTARPTCLAVTSQAWLRLMVPSYAATYKAWMIVSRERYCRCIAKVMLQFPTVSDAIGVTECAGHKDRRYPALWFCIVPHLYLQLSSP